jgi:hypothetical protein
MIKMAALVILLFVATLTVVAQDTEQEKDFIGRLEAFQKTGDMAGLPAVIWYDKSPGIFRVLTGDQFEAVIVRGIKSAKFEAVPEFMLKPTRLDGVDYVPNLEPYKMIAIDFQTEVKNGSPGFSMITGFKDGKIVICGLKIK